MPPSRGESWTKMKICAVGEEAVGKTSLIQRFVADKFEGEYTRTIGTLLSKKTLALEDVNGGPAEVDAVLWDIMGRRSFASLLAGAYFQKAKGIFAVCDITRRHTLADLHGWLVKVVSAVGLVPIIIMVNKSDLSERALQPKDLQKISETYGSPYFLTSAKTGDNVQPAFESLIRSILQKGEAPPDPSRGMPPGAEIEE